MKSAQFKLTRMAFLLVAVGALLSIALLTAPAVGAAGLAYGGHITPLTPPRSGGAGLEIYAPSNGLASGGHIVPLVPPRAGGSGLEIYAPSTALAYGGHITPLIPPRSGGTGLEI